MADLRSTAELLNLVYEVFKIPDNFEAYHCVTKEDEYSLKVIVFAGSPVESSFCVDSVGTIERDEMEAIKYIMRGKALAMLQAEEGEELEA